MARKPDSADPGNPGIFAGRAAGGGLVRVGRKQHAAGLVWETVAEGGKGAQAQAREAARRHGGDLVCLRKPAKTQYGVGSRRLGHKPGMAPLASFLAEAVEGSFVAVFEIEGGYYLAAVRDEQVLAGCDRLLADRQEAMEAFAELHYGSTWTQSIAPKDWGIEGTAPVRLDEALGGLRPRSLLAPADSRRALAALACVALIGAAGAAYVHHQEQEAQRLALEQAARERALREQRDKRAKADQPPPPPLPWENKQQGVPALSACVGAILAAPTEVAGWEPVGLTCAEARLTAAYKRAGGTINWISASLNRPGFRPSVTQSGPDTALVAWSIPKVALHARDAPTAPRAEVRRYLTASFEEAFQPVEIKLDDPKPVAVNTGRGVQNIPAPYQGLAFSLRTRHDPREFARILAPVPALVVTSVKLDLGTWTWSIEGNVYERIENAGEPAPAPPRGGDRQPRPPGDAR